MKTLRNEAFDATLASGKQLKGNYAELAIHALENIPQGGLGVKQMRARLRVLAALDGVQVGSLISLEDADAKTLQECVAVMPWGLVAKPIVEFCDAVENMKEPAAETPSEPEGSEGTQQS